MGYPALEAQYGPYIYSYSSSYRSELFAREVKNISNVEDMMRVMQLNRYQTDPLSLDSPELAIASRYDLSNSSDPFAPDLSGGIDSKITCWSWVKEGNMRTVAYSGSVGAKRKCACSYMHSRIHFFSVSPSLASLAPPKTIRLLSCGRKHMNRRIRSWDIRWSGIFHGLSSRRAARRRRRRQMRRRRLL
jgi:hypothetical protein